MPAKPGSAFTLILDQRFFFEAIRHRADTLGDCHNCTYWSICHGGCAHNALPSLRG